jgi:dihydroflavonol-4-reductase
MMKAFVTGSTGLLGGNLVRLLLEQGWEVKALARSPEKARKWLGGLKHVEIVQGDMEDVAAFAPHLAGVDVLFHTAAYFRESFGRGDHWPKLLRLNVDATIELLEAAEAHGVKKAIYTSSNGTIGMGANGQIADENTPPDRDTMSNLYFKSKVLADERVAAFVRTHRLPVVTIMPGWIHGPGDAAPTGGGQFVLEFLNGRFPGVLDGGLDVVDVRDVAQAMITMVERGRSGERYTVGGRYTTLAEFFKVLERVSGVRAPRMPLPTPMVLMVARVSEFAARLSGGETFMTVSGVRTLTAKKTGSSAKAITELGVSFRPLDETLRDSVAWFAANMPEALPKGFTAPRSLKPAESAV